MQAWACWQQQFKWWHLKEAIELDGDHRLVWHLTFANNKPVHLVAAVLSIGVRLQYLTLEVWFAIPRSSKSLTPIWCPISRPCLLLAIAGPPQYLQSICLYVYMWAALELSSCPNTWKLCHQISQFFISWYAWQQRLPEFCYINSFIPYACLMHYSTSLLFPIHDLHSPSRAMTSGVTGLHLNMSCHTSHFFCADTGGLLPGSFCCSCSTAS